MLPDWEMLGFTSQLAAGFLSDRVNVAAPMLNRFLNLQTYQQTD